MHQLLENYYIDIGGNECPAFGHDTMADELKRYGFCRFVDVHPKLIEYQRTTHNQPETHVASTTFVPSHCNLPALNDLGDEVDDSPCFDLIDWVCEQLDDYLDPESFSLRTRKTLKSMPRFQN